MNLHEFIHTPAITCGPETSLADAAGLMDRNNVGSLVVTGAGGAISGIVTDRDIAIRGVGKALAPKTAVSEIMTHDVVRLYDDSDVFEAARQMAASGCRRLPVTDRDGLLLGVVAFDDLMLLFARQTDNLAAAVAAEAATG